MVRASIRPYVDGSRFLIRFNVASCPGHVGMHEVEWDSLNYRVKAVVDGLFSATKQLRLVALLIV